LLWLYSSGASGQCKLCRSRRCLICALSCSLSLCLVHNPSHGTPPAAWVASCTFHHAWARRNICPTWDFPKPTALGSMRQQEICDLSNDCRFFENEDREMDHSVSRGGFLPTHALSRPAVHASVSHKALIRDSSDGDVRWFPGVCVYRLAYHESSCPYRLCRQWLGGGVFAIYNSFAPLYRSRRLDAWNSNGEIESLDHVVVV
jgi:hypothetical protein